MFVSDIYEDCRSITGFADETLNLSRISDAVDVLSNKGDFDAGLAYVDIKITNSLVVLPREVETPLAINIDGNPSFAWDKFFEFTLNGPGANASRARWIWEDNLTTPIMGTIATPSQLVFTNPAALDDGKTVALEGIAGGRLLKEILTLNNDTPQVSSYSYSSVTKIHKPVTLAPLVLYTSPASIFLSQYERYETEPQYRRIRVSKSTGTAHILFRRTKFGIRTQNDFIPLRSKMGLILMIKALEAYREGNIEPAKSFEAQSLVLTNEEQRSHNAGMERASQTQDGTARNFSLNSRDVVIVSDIYDEACKIVGPIGQYKVFDKITEAVAILSNKAQWDSQIGYVDIATDQYHYVTLPRYIDSVIELNINGRPAEMKNKWFEFNMNGPGEGWMPCASWGDAGTVVTARDLLYPQHLILRTDLEEDVGLTFRVFGYYRGQRIYSTNSQGESVDGFILKPRSDGAISSTQPVDRIERITKTSTVGFVRLSGRDLNGLNETQLGYYWPEENEPTYRRIKLPMGCERVRIMYRRRSNQLSAFYDSLHLKSKTAVLTMLRAIELLNQGKAVEAEALEQKAVRYLIDEQLISNQSLVQSIDFGNNFTVSNQYVPWA